jgi:hypothetical protein
MKKLIPWLSAAVILVIVFGTIFVVAQQLQRHDDNYPQVQIAEDMAAALEEGTRPASLPRGRVDIRRSLAPFTIIYDKSGRVVAGSGYLDSKVPVIPYGVLMNGKGKAYHTVTWQPAAGVRIAAVSVAARDYYVVSGRSLTEIEKSVTQSLELSAFGCLVSLVVLVGAFRLYNR